MAEVRCPMCGKSNPEELEVCQFCQARLKPLIFSPQEGDEAPAVPQGGASGDWLDALRGGEAGGEGDAPAEGEGGEGEGADWLERIRERKESEGIPPTLASFVNEIPEVEPGAKDEDLSWLDSIREKEPGEGEAPGQGAAPGQGEAPDQGEAPAGETEGGDWLERLREKQDVEGGAGAEDGALPDWLQAPGGEAAGAGQAPAGEGSAELPDWLSGAEPAPAEGGPAAELPDWLAAAGSEAQPAAEEGIPDWLASIREREGAAAEGEAPAAEEPAQAGEVPDWLASLGTGAAAEGETPEAEEPAPAGESAQAGEVPDWLASLEPGAAAEGEAPAAEQPAPAGESAQAGEVPDWLASIREREAGEGAGSAAPFLEGEAATRPPEPEPEEILPSGLPDWLAQIKPGEMAEAPSSEVPTGPSEGAGDLAPAELPSWVQAMRPIESAAPKAAGAGSEETLVEKAGPLAGLQGILPSEPIGEITRPPVFSVKLGVSEKQRAQATLLESLLAGEAEPQKPRAVPTVSASQRMLRLVVTLLLLAAVILPLVSGTQLVPLPQLYPSETVAELDLIAALPEGAPVLVAVEYQPALAGEMQASAAAVVEQLMARSARLTLISTSPSGPALGQALLNEVIAGTGGLADAYKGSQYVTNLGYLAGGTAGLADLAARPKQAQVYAFDSSEAWSQPALQGVNALSDFAQVLVITDSADTGRAWIEQVGPALGATPLAVVVSAQSAPLMQPYYESGQVKGLVAGLAGGAAIEGILQRPALARDYWDSFQAALTVAVILIVAGGLINVAGILLAQRKERGGVSS